MTSAQILITIQPFNENTLKLSLPYDELKVATHKIIEIRSPMAGMLKTTEGSS